MTQIKEVGQIKEVIRDFVFAEFLPGEDPTRLGETTPLITGGIVDSVGAMRLVSFLEERFSIEVGPDEADLDHLNNIASIVNLVQSKL